MRIHSHSVSNLWPSRVFRSSCPSSGSDPGHHYCPLPSWAVLLCENKGLKPDSVVNIAEGLQTILEIGGESNSPRVPVVPKGKYITDNNEGLMKDNRDGDGDTDFSNNEGQCRPSAEFQEIGANRS